MKAKVVASENGSVGIGAALDVLLAGGSAVEAVLAGLELVEANPADHSVGYSGLPNILGQVELDASVMVGDGLRAGSVAALQHYQDASRLAHRVMEHLPHVLVAGEGAAMLAAESGFERKDLLTPEAEAIWRTGIENGNAAPGLQTFLDRMREIVASLTTDPQLVERPFGTVNFICQDRDGRIASGVSTSGWAWKYPGRVGDSPIIGAGNYCDDRFGAAACTGRGEMAQRACTAHSIVTFLRFDMDVDAAVRLAFQDFAHLDDPFAGEMNVIVLTASGEAFGASSAEDRRYVYQEEGMQEHEVRSREIVPLD